MKRVVSVVGVASLSLAGAQAQASGFRLPEASIAGTALSNALVANHKEIGALAYNPAAMSFHDGTQLAAGMIFLTHDVSVTPAGGTAKVDSDHKELAYLPNLYIANRLNADWSWGLNISAPFGLETKWPGNTFPALWSPPQMRAIHPAESKIEVINFNPNFSYRINTNTSAAIGIDYYRVREVKLNTHAATVNGDGGDLGWNAALMHVAGPWSFGASYRSAVTVALDGKIDSPVSKGDISADLNLPWMAQIGARYQATDNLGVEFDIERTGWKKFNQILVNANANGAILVNNTNGWKSANAYRLGITYDLGTGTQLRAGYSRDLAGQGDDRFTARVPDADRNLFSVGVKQKLANDWAVEAAYMYVKFDDRDYASTVPFGTYGTDPNGTSVYNGKYQSNAHLFGLGVTKKF